jgi:hypothetical protein
MNRVSPPGSIIIINKADREPKNGRYYGFDVKGETSFKVWQAAYLASFSTEDHKPVFFKKRDMDVVGRVRRTMLDF